MQLNQITNSLFGVHQTPIIRETTTVDEINERIRGRHFSGTPGQLAGAQPVFASVDRPFSTKYTHWSVPNTQNTNPYSSVAAKQVISQMPSRVNMESELRNQYEALQKASQAVYVPSSASDLYFRSPTAEPMAPSAPVSKIQSETGLWAQHRWSNHPDALKFNNSTRTQMRQPTNPM